MKKNFDVHFQMSGFVSIEAKTVEEAEKIFFEVYGDRNKVLLVDYADLDSIEIVEY